MRTRTVCLATLLLLGLAPRSLAQPSEWCVDLDQISAVAHDSTITVFHTAAFYNCCPVDIAYSLEQAGSTFIVRETEIEPQCLCFCCFNLSVDIEHVPPGDYLIEFHWDNFETGPEVRVVPVTVPDLGQEAPAALGDRAMSACLSSADAADVTPRGGPVLGPAIPNPTAAGATFQVRLPVDGPARMTIHSAAGTELRELGATRAQGTVRHFFWDGRDASGRPVPGGVYFARVTAMGGKATRAVIVIR